MGAWRSTVGTTMAAKHAPSIGRSNMKLAVISVTRMMPVRGARTAILILACNGFAVAK